MGINAEYIRLTGLEFKQFLDQPELVKKFLGHGHGDPEIKEWFEYFDMMKAEGRVFVVGTQWQALFYFLTNEVVGPEVSHISSPLYNMVFGVSSVPFEGYEEEKYLTPEDVKEIATEIESLTPEIILTQFTFRKHTTIQLYKFPPPTEWDEFDLNWLQDYYIGLREMYIEAAKEGGAMLISIG